MKIKDLLKEYGLKTARSEIAENEKEAIRIAENLGYPVAIKVESCSILHKSEIGGVRLNLCSAKEVSKAFKIIYKKIKSINPNVKIDGFLVQEMVSEGFEIILGYSNDDIFGPMIMLGMGGIFTETVKDVVFRVLPIDLNDAEEMINELKYSKILLEGFRGIPPVSKDMLRELIYRLGKMSMKITGDFDSFDLNPVFVWKDKHKIADVKYITTTNRYKTEELEPNIENLENFFTPRSVAVFGASSISSDKLGNYILDSLAFHDFKGKIYPVNAKANSIKGLKAYKSLLDIPGRVELAVISIPLKKVPDILVQCAQLNIHNVVIISGGGKEVGEFELEKKIKEMARNNRIRIIGCNCLGIFDGYSRIDTNFQTHERLQRPKSGKVSLITQSGTVGLSLLEDLKDIGISKFISYGNKIDVDEADLIEFLRKDVKTEIIAAYIEGLSNGRKLTKSLRKTSKEKPIIVYKAGRTVTASKASQSHTGFLTGTPNVFTSVFNQCGVISVDSFEELKAATKAVAAHPGALGNKTMIITNGAGTSIQALDRIEKKEILKLSELSRSTTNKLNSKLPEYVIIGNPLDLTGSSPDKNFEIALEEIISDPNVDIIMLWIIFLNSAISTNICSVLKKVFNKSNKPIICGANGGKYTKKTINRCSEMGIPVFTSVGEWVSAAEAVYLTSDLLLKN